VFIYQQAIDRTTYETQRDKLREELTLAELATHDAKIEAFDVEGIQVCRASRSKRRTPLGRGKPGAASDDPASDLPRRTHV